MSSASIASEIASNEAQVVQLRSEISELTVLIDSQIPLVGTYNTFVNNYQASISVKQSKAHSIYDHAEQCNIARSFQRNMDEHLNEGSWGTIRNSMY